MPDRARSRLTPRQWQVLERVAAGEGNAAIAAALGLSVNTVSGYLAAIYQCLPPADGRKKRAAAAAWYRAVGHAQRARLEQGSGEVEPDSREMAGDAQATEGGAPDVGVPLLTPLQWRILALLARGANDWEIARVLLLSRVAVSHRLAVIYPLLPLGAATNRRAAAVVWYLREGYKQHEEVC